VSGNVVKLFLGNVSVFFDIIFITQHYIIYPKKNRKPDASEDDPLLGSEHGRQE
jgi:cystinosin